MPPRKRHFGRVRKLPSGRWQARYPGPDGIDRPAPQTFHRRRDAETWLSQMQAELAQGQWHDPDAGTVALAVFAAKWVSERPNLRPKTRQLYDGLLRLHIGPTLGGCALSEITPARVRSWRSGLLSRGVGEVTAAKAYRLLRTVMQTAVEDRLIRANPCQIRGAAVERSAERPTLTVAEVRALADAMPPRFRLLVLLATFCSLRWGELAALTRANVDVDEGFVHVRATLVELADGSLVVGPPKTAAGHRVVAFPPALTDDVRRHLDEFVAPGTRALVFVGPKGAALRRSNFQRMWRKALDGAGLADRGLHFHDLRHTGNTLTAQSGATVADLMARMGHASSRAAMIYMHTTSKRDRAVAAALDSLLLSEATGTQRAREGS